MTNKPVPTTNNNSAPNPIKDFFYSLLDNIRKNTYIEFDGIDRSAKVNYRQKDGRYIRFQITNNDEYPQV